MINITFPTFFQNVGSTNYIHALDRSVPEFKDLPVGQKYWVFIPRYHAHLFEKLCDVILKDLNYQCPNYLAHRFLMANPQLLLDAGIDVFHAVQYEGQTMVIFPKVYHCGKLNLKIFHIKLSTYPLLCFIIQDSMSTSISQRQLVTFRSHGSEMVCTQDLVHLNVHR